MGKNIRKCIKELVKLEKEFSYRELETALYVYARLGETMADDLTNEELEELSDVMENIDGSIFNEDLNDWSFNNLEV